MLYLIGGSALAFFLFICMILTFVWRRVVPTNMVHIVQSGKASVSYGHSQPAGNSYYAFPSWLPKIGVLVTTFPESVFNINLKDYEAYDIGRLPFVIDVSAFFRISDSQVAAKRVSNFSELQTQLMAVLQGSVRRILATNALENTMQDRAKLGVEFTNEVDHQLAEWGVSTVKMIEFMDIRDSRDSQVIHNMMAKEKSRIEMESRIAVASNHQTAQSMEIEAERTISINKTAAAQEVGLRDAEASKMVGLAKEQASQAIQEEAAKTAERLMAVRSVEQVAQANIDRDVTVVRAEAANTVTVTNAQAEAATLVALAEGQLQTTLKNAEGVAALGTAKAAAEAAMLLAPVTAQLKLAEEIGGNEGYQQYLLGVRQIEANQAVGIETAGALKAADLKIIANSGDVQGGITGLANIFTPSGGTALAGMLTAITQTEAGKAVVDKIVGPAAIALPKA